MTQYICFDCDGEFSKYKAHVEADIANATATHTSAQYCRWRRSLRNRSCFESERIGTKGHFEPIGCVNLEP